MNFINFTLRNLSLILLFTFSFTTLFAQEEIKESIDPLAPFSRLIGGEWHLDGSFQVFEWGVGKLSVRSRGYFIIDGKPKLVSEGSWIWHPGEQKIKGYFTAIEMPVLFIDYTTTFQENKMVNTLLSYSALGIPDGYNYREIWEFTDDDHFTWTLFGMTKDGEQKMMGGNYSRKNVMIEK